MMATGWSIIESPFRVEHAKAYEGLFTLGSGYLHVRGSLEEHLSGAPQNVSYTRMPANVTSEKFPDTKVKWGTYVPGIFGRHPLLNNEMINLPWFLGMVPIIDGERLDLENCRILHYRRELHLDTATLTRTVRWHTRAHKQVDLVFERFVSAVHLYLCVQRLRIRGDREAHLRLVSGIEADVRTNGHDHFRAADCRGTDGLTCECRVMTDAGDQVLVATKVHCGLPQDRDCELAFSAEPAARGIHIVAEGTLPADREVVFEKRSAVVTSRDPVRSDAESQLVILQNRSYERLHAAHADAWRRRWQACDVIIEGGEASQLAMRASLFHLLRAHVPDDPRVAIDAKGYAGEAYWGRYFWDTEMFLLPFFLYTDPARARTLVDFRVQSLDGAIMNATRYGYRGARYAWESDAAGYECCPNWQYADHEVHVTADVAYGLVHYARATGDASYLTGPAARVLVETARYWQERIDIRLSEEFANLLGVMGPDEYKPISNNNAYTNRMVAFALDAAAEFGKAAGASKQECEHWRRLARGLPILRADDGVLVLQCEGFDRFADPRFDLLWKDRGRPFAAQVSQERLYRSKCLKQADVLMMMSLFPGEFSEAEVRRAWEYYLPYTTHDSSLSAGVHAIVACRLGLMDEAWAFWQKARAIDLDIEHGGAAEGIHIANAAAVWQMAVLGFAGMRTAMQADVLTLDPRLPAAWSRLAFPIVWKGAAAYVDIGRDGVTVTNRGGVPMEVCVWDERRTLGPQELGTWAARR
jgi:trehalose/maltose hydrolase-like predicted phosphorylase